jgi:hypothetical protein
MAQRIAKGVATISAWERCGAERIGVIVCDDLGSDLWEAVV